MIIHEVAAYTGHFDPKEEENNQLLIAELGELFERQRAVIIAGLPALHRIQRVFGPSETLKRSFLITNLGHDLKHMAGAADPEDTATALMETLDAAYFAILLAYSPPGQRHGREIDIEKSDIRETIITRTIQREWKPWERPEMGMVDSLLRHTLGALSYTNITHTRDADPFAELSYKENPDGTVEADREYSFQVSHGGGRIFSPSAEQVFFQNESRRELDMLSRGLLLNEYLHGSDISELSRRHNIRRKELLRQLHEELILVQETGRDEYGWTGALIQAAGPRKEVFQRWRIPEIKDFWQLFSERKIDLTMVMGAIDRLHPLQKKVLLHLFGYLDEQHLTRDAFLEREQLSWSLYRNAAINGLDGLWETVGPETPLTRSIPEVVRSCKEYAVIRNSEGRRIDETNSLPLRILELVETGSLGPGNMSQREMRIAQAVESLRAATGSIPSLAAITKAAGFSKKSEVVGLIKVMCAYDYSQPRYATTDYQLVAGSANYRLIDWWRRHDDPARRNREIQMLSPRQQHILAKATEIRNGSYLTPEEIWNDLATQMPDEEREKFLKSIGGRYVSMLEAFTRVGELDSLERALTTILAGSPSGGVQIVAESLHLRLQSGGSFAKGWMQEVAAELSIHPDTLRRILRTIQETS